MALYPSGNRLNLVEIDCDDCFLIITGGLDNEKMSQLKLNRNVPANILVKSVLDNNIKIKTITDYGELVLNPGTTMMPCFFEDGQYQLAMEVKDKGSYDIYHGGIKLTDNFQMIGNVSLGMIDFRSDIGYTNIQIYKDEKKILDITLEVFPSKLDYRYDYIALMNEINEEACSLAFKFLDKTYLTSNLIDNPNQTNTEFINILEIIFNDLEKALNRIVHKFKHNVISNERLSNINRAKRISSKNRSYLRTHSENLIDDDIGFINIAGQKYYPLKVIEEIKITTIDIYENRFVKYMIQRIIQRLGLIEGFLNKEENSTLKSIRDKKNKLQHYLKIYFQNISDLKGKKSMSLVFQMAPGYKEMYKKYVMLNKGLDLGDDLFKITPKKLYSLYEMWCYIKIHRILSDLGYEVEEYGIIEYKDNGLYLSLLQDSQTKMVYTSSKNKIELWYNKSYTSPTTDQRPDTVLHIRNMKDKNQRVYIFDAKYRLSIDSKGVVGPMVDDINVMHRYRDAIVSKINDKFNYKYETFGAYVMFPYGNEDEFSDHRFYKSIDEVNVGAFPMLPGSTKLITTHLKKIINQSHLEAKNERVVVDEYDDYAKFKLQNVMVVNVKDSKHFNVYKENQFYHIPANKLSNVRLGVEYLAFYQSKKSFGDEGGIRYFGKIKDVVRYKRKECSEMLSRKGSEEDTYLRFNLEAIDEISHIGPIQSGTQLVSYTTLYLLKNAENMHELKLNSNLEIEVYKKLKIIGEENNWNIRKEFNQYIINKNTVEIIEDKKIKVNGKPTELKYMERLMNTYKISFQKVNYK